MGLGLAQLLGIPAVSVAGKVEVDDGKARVETMLPDGYQVVEASLPLLVTVSHEVGDLRYPSLMAIKQAKNLPMETLKPADLGLDPASLGLGRDNRTERPPTASGAAAWWRRTAPRKRAPGSPRC